MPDPMPPPPPPPPPRPMRTRALTRSSVRRGRSCARPAQLARALRADGDGQGPKAHGQAVGASGQDEKIRQVSTRRRRTCVRLLAPPLSRPHLRTPSALRAPWATLGPALQLHTRREVQGERHSWRGDRPRTVPTLGRSLAKLSTKRNSAGRKLKRGR